MSISARRLAAMYDASYPPSLWNGGGDGGNPSPTGIIEDFNPIFVAVGPAGTFLGWNASLHGWNLGTATRVTVNGVDVRAGSIVVDASGQGAWPDEVQYDPPLFPTPGVATVVVYLADGTVTAPPPTFEYRSA